MNKLTAEAAMIQINDQLAHVWMVRTFLKHSPEADADEDVRDILRNLYDYCLAVGPSWAEQDAAAFLKIATKKRSKLRKYTELFLEIQPEVSSHMNFQMAAHSLRLAVAEVEQVLDQWKAQQAAE